MGSMLPPSIKIVGLRDVVCYVGSSHASWDRIRPRIEQGKQLGAPQPEGMKLARCTYDFCSHATPFQVFRSNSVDRYRRLFCARVTCATFLPRSCQASPSSCMRSTGRDNDMRERPQAAATGACHEVKTSGIYKVKERKWYHRTTLQIKITRNPRTSILHFLTAMTDRRFLSKASYAPRSPPVPATSTRLNLRLPISPLLLASTGLTV